MSKKGNHNKGKDQAEKRNQIRDHGFTPLSVAVPILWSYSGLVSLFLILTYQITKNNINFFR